MQARMGRSRDGETGTDELDICVRLEMAIKKGKQPDIPAVPSELQPSTGLEGQTFFLDGSWYVIGGDKLKPISKDQAQRLSTVYRCMTVISDDIASLPLQVFTKTGERRSRMARNARTRNSAYLAEVRPNRWMTPFIFKKLIVQSLHVDGNAYVWQPLSGYPERFILNPTSVTPMFDEQGNKWFLFRPPNGEKDVLLPDPEVWHVMINPVANGLYGRSVLALAKETLSRQWYSNEARGEFQGSGLLPKALLKVAGNLDDKNRSTVKKKFLEAAADGVAVMDSKILDFKPLSISPEDAQFLQSIEATDREIANYFGLPEYKLNQGKQSYQSNEQQQLEYLGTTLNPYLVQIEQEANLKWLTEEEAETTYHLFERKALLQITASARAEYMSKMIGNGLMSPNEGRQIEDMDRYEGGDKYFFPANMAVITPDGLELATNARIAGSEETNEIKIPNFPGKEDNAH